VDCTVYTELPIRALTLDPRLTRRVRHHTTGGPSARTAIAWLVGLLHDLDGTVTASGIHDRTHLHLVEELGCDRARGAHLAGARIPTAIDRLLNPPGPSRTG
jgi:EAL domain-containing protein (putative c-di-GMP-specific phosphodiesterase class I)